MEGDVVALKSRDAHVLHKANRGGKYAQELQDLRKLAEPNRKSAMAEIDALQKRASGEDSPSTSSLHSNRQGGHIQQAVLDMGRHGSKERHHDGLGRLAAAHGIESSKKMLAEIMSLRHYKKSNNEIQELSNGFESHSSVSHRSTVFHHISHHRNFPPPYPPSPPHTRTDLTFFLIPLLRQHTPLYAPVRLYTPLFTTARPRTPFYTMV